MTPRKSATPRTPVAEAAEEFAFLHSCGIGVRDIVRSLGLTPKSLETGLARAGRGDLVTVLRRAYLSPSWETPGNVTDHDRIACRYCGGTYTFSTDRNHRSGQCATQLGQVAS